MTNEEFTFSTDMNQTDMKAGAALYESVGFGTAKNYEIPGVSLERLFGPGVYGFFVFKDGQLIGLARVFSDNVMCAWIAELCVHPDWQKRGIGGSLLDLVNRRFGNTALYADAFRGQEMFFKRRSIVPQSRLVACGRTPVES